MSSKKRKVHTLEPLNAYDRDKRMWEIRQSYSRGQRPSQPRTRHELDILKERHQFVRSNEIDPSSLSWEDQLAAKYYDSLFKEFAIVNLKHWKTGQIGLRWRTEDEVLNGIGHLTCASMRCTYHQPSPELVEQFLLDSESNRPLVETRLEESEMNFGYLEGGEKKTALVKVVLCRECGKKLRRGKEEAKRERERLAQGTLVETVAEGSEKMREQSGDEQGSRHRRRDRSDEPRGDDDAGRRTRAITYEASPRRWKEADSDDDDCAPALPPDFVRQRPSPSRQISPDRSQTRSQERRSSSSARRSASPPARHR